MKKDCIASSFEKCYRFSFDKTIDEDICDKVKHILENKDLDDAQKSLRLLELSSNEDDRCLSFSLFAIGGIFLNLFYKDYIVIPVYLFDKLKAITTNYGIRDVFFKSLIELNLKHHDYDLKERIINEYINKKDEFISYGIDKLLVI